MKLQRNIFASLLLLSIMVLGFASCSDDDDNKFNPDNKNAIITNLSFTDTDLTENKIGGILSWTKPKDIADVKLLTIYSSTDGTTKGAKIADVDVNEESYSIAENTLYSEYLIVVSTSQEGVEYNVIASLKIKDTTEGSGSEENPTLSNVYVLSSGGMGSNSSVLLSYDPVTQKTTNLFESANGVKLGDTGQDMVKYGSKLYVSVYNSGLIYILDNKTGKKLAEIKDDSEKLQPRMFEAYNGKVYVTSFDGYIARIDTTSLAIDKKVAVGPNPEFVKVVNNKVYVANSGGLNWLNGYNNTVSILNPDLSDKKDIEVAVNPVELDVDKYNNLYLISRGNYGDVPNTLQSINTTSNEVKVLDTGRSYSMFAISEKLYLLKKEYVNSKPTSSFTYWDIASSKIVEQSFITDGTAIADISYVTVEPESGNYYVAAANGSNTGDVYIFSAGGKFISKFDTGAAYPMKILFIYK